MNNPAKRVNREQDGPVSFLKQDDKTIRRSETEWIELGRRHDNEDNRDGHMHQQKRFIEIFTFDE